MQTLYAIHIHSENFHKMPDRDVLQAIKRARILAHIHRGSEITVQNVITFRVVFRVRVTDKEVVEY